MEEFVGNLWHKLVTRAATRGHAHAAVKLEEIEKTAGVLFRALGGEPALRVAPAGERRHGARRRLLERVAGTSERIAPCSLDEETLQLPPHVDLFAERALNRDLYLWLIALAAPAGDGAAGPGAQDWFAWNQRAARAVLERYPGLAARYARLVEEVIALRPDPASLPADEAEAEKAIRMALRQPGQASALPAARKPPQPVPLWLYPALGGARSAAAAQADAPAEPRKGSKAEEGLRERKQAEREQAPDGKDGFLMMFRAESLFSWAEYVKVNRPQDDDPNPDAARAARDMDHLTLTRDGSEAASKVRFDLDLPGAAQDDVPLCEGILLPEWDYRKRRLLPDACRVQPLTARDAPAVALPRELARPARRLRAQFSALQPTRRWMKNQADGPELDLDACVRAQADRAAGASGPVAGGYLAQVACERDLACLALADLSLSTDAWVSDHHRVIDVVKDSLMLFAEALEATGDRYALYGFSSLKRTNVRVNRLKGFDERYDAAARGRVAALKPGYYTRMGAALRYASTLLGAQKAQVRLLLLLTDGKPNDLDHYEGRYGIEDTRVAVMEARRLGLRPFCVTIDREGEDYLPHLFGPAGYTVVRKPEELPSRLPLLYAQLTQR